MRVLLALMLSFGLASNAWAAPDKTPRPSTDRAATALAPNKSQLPDPGSCEVGRGTGTLDVNQIQATVFTTGTLFYGPTGAAQYFAPQAGDNPPSPVYASSVWIGGLIDGELHVAGTTYGQGANGTAYEFWPGPLDDDGEAPDDCSDFDRIYVVSRQNILDFEAGGEPAEDLREWPVELGAPVIDGDGVEGNYNLAGGDRPDIIGDQSLWYILNDVGNTHKTTSSDPIGLEVRVQAFAFARDNALGFTTFYKYSIEYKGESDLTMAYLTVFSDPDLGGASDDYVGVDPGISMGYVYNAQEVDEVYGSAPPAIGYDFFQGPEVSEAEGGMDEDGDGEFRLGLSSYMYFVNGDANRGDPRTAEEYYNVMRGRWRDGTAMTAFGNGYNTAGDETTFAFPGNPVTREFWSEEATGAGRGTAEDKRFTLSTGPFTIEPGDTQEIVFGIVYGRGNNRLSSIEALRAGDVFAQQAYDLDFDLPVPASPPPLCETTNNPTNIRTPGSGRCFYASEVDGQVVLNWGYAPTDPAYLGNYESKGYDFEGFNLYRYPNGRFNKADRELVATYDKDNEVTTLQNEFFDPQVGAVVPTLAAQGTNSGLDYSYLATNLTNYTDYYYGLTTYIVDPEQLAERVIESAPNFLTVRPSRIRSGSGGTTTRSNFLAPIATSGESRVTGGAPAFADVVDPSQVTGDRYQVRYYTYECQSGTPDDDSDNRSILTYNIENLTTGEVIFSGADYAEGMGRIPDVEDDPDTTDADEFADSRCEVLLSDPSLDDPVVTADGIQFRVEPQLQGAATEIATPSGIAPCGPDAMNTESCPPSGPGNLVYNLIPQPPVLTNVNSTGQYAVTYPTNAAAGSYGTANSPGGSLARFFPNNYEIRFVGEDEGSYGYYLFSTGNLIRVPFQVWDIGELDFTGPNAFVNDPSDDQQIIPVLFADNAPDEEAGETAADVECVFEFAGPAGRLAGGGPMSQRIYAYYPVDNNYAAYEAAASAAVNAADNGCAMEPASDAAAALINTAASPNRPLERDVIIPFGIDEPSELEGAIYRFLNFPPAQEGDTYVFDTSDLVPQTALGLTDEDAEQIGIVPNPYYGFSEYESDNTERVARFTNLPERATIRIFTISGTLVRTLTKESNQRSFDWNLQTENGLPVASGLYLIHIELPDSGLERVIKFGVVNRQTQIEIL